MRNSMNHPSLALCLAALTALSASFSCEKTPGAGSGVSFRAKAYSTSGTSTKTEYGGIEDSGQSYEYLHWVSGDRIRVYSPQAVKIYTADVHFADYKVDGIRTDTDNKTSVATLLSFDDGNGLGWGEENPHYFYSVYPSPAVNSNITIEEGTGSNAVTVTGVIPAAQTLDWTTSGTSITGTPDMNYAYMYASTTSTPSASVELTFRPAFTAFQIEVSGASATPVSVSSFTLSSTSSALCGTFTLAVNDALTPAFSGPAYSAGVNNSVSCTLGGGTPVSLTSANTLVLTVFALPLDLSDLSISFTTDTGTRTLLLSSSAGSPISFAARKKYRIHGLQLSRTGIVSAGVSITSEWGESVLTPEVVVSE